MCKAVFRLVQVAIYGLVTALAVVAIFGALDDHYARKLAIVNEYHESVLNEALDKFENTCMTCVEGQFLVHSADCHTLVYGIHNLCATTNIDCDKDLYLAFVQCMRHKGCTIPNMLDAEPDPETCAAVDLIQ